MPEQNLLISIYTLIIKYIFTSMNLYIEFMCSFIELYGPYKDKKESRYGFFLETNYLFDLYYTDWWGNNNYRCAIISTVISYRVRST